MSSELILHIGTHKTGTTALQASLHANESALKAAGYAYPLMPEKWPTANRERNAYWLNLAALQAIDFPKVGNPGKIPPCLECFTQAVATSAETIILSDERMWYSGTTKKYWEAVRSIVEEVGIAKTTIVVYLRRQDLFIESLWAQYVKGRLSQDLDAYLAKRKTQKICDYAAGVKRLQDVFGKENVVVRIYDKTQLVGGDTITDFFSVLGFETGGDIIRLTKSKNDSLSPSVTVLKLALNKNPEYKNADSNYLRSVFLTVSRQDDVKRGSFLSPKQRKAFLATYESGNAQLARDLFDRDELFPIKDGELEQEAVQIDAKKLASQASKILVVALQSEQRKHDREIDKLKGEIEELKRREKARFGNRLKRFLKRIFKSVSPNSVGKGARQ